MIYLPVVSGWKGSLGVNAYVERWKQLVGGTKINFKIFLPHLIFLYGFPLKQNFYN